MQDKIKEAFSKLKIDVEVKEPIDTLAFTLYPIITDERVKKVLACEQDIQICLELNAKIKIINSQIVIEVPKEKRETLLFADCLEELKKSEVSLPIIMGQNLQGKIVIEDLTKTPHMLVAGATGSGKSVFINSIICSLLASRDNFELALIDLKKVELSVYKNLPNIYKMFANEVYEALWILEHLVDEMDERYDKLAKFSCRNIIEYNDKFPDDKMKYIVCIIDELADLMMQAPKKIEYYIQRLTQLARACGIHLIVATQRPSREVLTGIIKANIPTRVAFTVASQIDSRVILDKSGAEKLLGKGDMLYLGFGELEAGRIQACFIDEKRIEEMIK